ncbi:MAG: DUF4920 domain-containing protein [Candidatus Kapaibacteriota bacterium]
MNILIMFIILIFASSCSEQKEYLGDQPKYEGNVLSITELMTKNMKNTHVRIKGKIYEVCKTEGCWFIVSDTKTKLRCSFAKPSLFMDMKNKSKSMSFEGKLTDEIVDEYTAKTFAEQSGEDTSTILGKKRVPLFIVSTILIDQ